MTNKRNLGLIVVIVIAVVAALASAGVFGTSSPQYQEAHYHAGFQVYVDGELQDYSGIQHMHISPCVVDAAEYDLSSVKDRVHLHESVGDVAHIHAEGTTWYELFASLEITDLIDEENAVYISNGEQVTELFETQIEPYQSTVFAFGDSEGIDDLISNAVEDDYIREAEQAIESCGGTHD